MLMRGCCFAILDDFFEKNSPAKITKPQRISPQKTKKERVNFVIWFCQNKSFRIFATAFEKVP
ncbi:hypothetical protein DDZ16_11660 [Marinilabilia rubra]|uniref:Uncharacterized protein n=1 Tax=Marinilabilia rubra TaxID=2162893 RepID=A0A2U2B862_9BACT|nr:hypothetical protein DDZ16_11660 [Marinilabilia rubra]